MRELVRINNAALVEACRFIFQRTLHDTVSLTLASFVQIRDVFC